MSLLNTITPTNAEGEIAAVYEEINQTWGMVPNPIQLYSVSPELLKNQWGKYKYLGASECPSQKMYAMIRLLVSKEAECEYCIGLNAGMLIEMFGLSVEEVQALKSDPSTASLDEKEKALLLFVLKAVSDPHSTTAEDLHQLRVLGLSDQQIFEAIEAGATMRAGNIIFDTFKVEVDY